MTTMTRFIPMPPSPRAREKRPTARVRCAVYRELEIVREVDLHAVPLANRHGRQPIQEPVQALRRRLCRRIADIAGDDDCPIPSATAEGGGPEVLRKTADETDRAGRPECRLVVLVHLIAEPCVSDVIQAHERIQRVRPSIRKHKSIERYGKPRFPDRLNRLCFAKDA